MDYARIYGDGPCMYMYNKGWDFICWMEGLRWKPNKKKSWGDLRKLIDKEMQHNKNQHPPFTQEITTYFM